MAVVYNMGGDAGRIRNAGNYDENAIFGALRGIDGSLHLYDWSQASSYDDIIEKQQEMVKTVWQTILLWRKQDFRIQLGLPQKSRTDSLLRGGGVQRGYVAAWSGFAEKYATEEAFNAAIKEDYERGLAEGIERQMLESGLKMSGA